MQRVMGRKGGEGEGEREEILNKSCWKKEMVFRQGLWYSKGKELPFLFNIFSASWKWDYRIVCDGGCVLFPIRLYFY